MRRSVLGHLVPLIRQAEPAATRALHYLLDDAPDISLKFVELLTGEQFDVGRIVSEWQFKEVRPDLAIYDTQGEVRLFVENKFWAPLTKYQPVAYLEALRDHRESTLAFIAPDDRTVSLWTELKEECERAGLVVADETTATDFQRIRVDESTLLLTSWRCVLHALQHAAAAGGHGAIEQDIVQLRGLTERMNSDIFLPLHGKEPTDVRLPRRLLNYACLIDAITKQLVKAGVADTTGLTTSGWGRHLRVHDRFVLYLCISFTTWRDLGVTPLWCTMDGSSSGVGKALSGIQGRIPGAHLANDGGLRIPIRIKVGVERDRVVEDAVKQIHSLAEQLQKCTASD